ncbi:MAG: putative ABC transporter permease subunit, partial [Candidatus Poribacteria bacterium]
SLPIKMSMIMWTKFLLSFCLNLIITFTFTVFMLMMKKFESISFIRIFILAFVISIFFSSIGLGLSALFPKFDWSNPARAVSISAFLGFYFITMFFITTLALVSYSHWYFIALGGIIWTIISIALVKMGKKKLEKLDF